MVSVVVQCLLNCFHGATRRGTKKTSDRAENDDDDLGDGDHLWKEPDYGGMILNLPT